MENSNRVGCILTLILGAVVFLTGLCYALRSDVKYEPIEAHVDACETTVVMCGELPCTKITIQVSFNQTFSYNCTLTYFVVDALICPQGTVTIFRRVGSDYYCIEKYDPSCNHNSRAGIVTIYTVGFLAWTAACCFWMRRIKRTPDHV